MLFFHAFCLTPPIPAPAIARCLGARDLASLQLTCKKFRGGTGDAWRDLLAQDFGVTYRLPSSCSDRSSEDHWQRTYRQLSGALRQPSPLRFRGVFTDGGIDDAPGSVSSFWVGNLFEEFPWEAVRWV